MSTKIKIDLEDLIYRADLSKKEALELIKKIIFFQPNVQEFSSKVKNVAARIQEECD